MSSILVVLALPVVLLFAWFCIEYARVHKHAGRAKLAADAAALAAAARFADGPEAARTDAIAAAAGLVVLVLVLAILAIEFHPAFHLVP